MVTNELVPLGRTDLMVSRLGLGLAPLGGMYAEVSLEQATATIDRAWELGVRFFDTAPVYGYGRSEQRAGMALRSRQRDEYVLCTKVGRLIEPGGPDTQDIWANPPEGLGPRRDYGRAGVRRSLEESLERLGVGHVDLLHIHDPDLAYQAALTEAFPALMELRADGVIGAVSLGVNHADVAARFLREAAEPGPDCVLIAGRYSLLDQSATHELLPVCADRGIALISAGLLHGGILGDPAPSSRGHQIGLPGKLTDRAAHVRAACRDHGVPPLAAAIQFPFGHPSVVAVLVGARTPAEMAASAAALAHPIPPSFWADLERRGLVPPGPSGPAYRD